MTAPELGNRLTSRRSHMIERKGDRRQPDATRWRVCGERRKRAYGTYRTAGAKGPTGAGARGSRSRQEIVQRVAHTQFRLRRAREPRWRAPVESRPIGVGQPPHSEACEIASSTDPIAPRVA